MFSWTLFNQAPIVGILRGYSEPEILQIMSCYHQSGLTTIEITMNTEGAAGIIKAAVERFGDQLNIGAGTVISEQDLANALEAGASFIVTPVVNQTVIEKAVTLNIPIFPGAFTPTEIFTAWSMGAKMIKVFPTTFLGPDYIKELKAPLNHIKLLATGGVTLQNMVEFFVKGSDGVAMASQLFPKELIKKEDWKGLSEVFEEVLEIYRSIKRG